MKLTKKRAAWARGRKGVTFRSKPMRNPAGVEARYAKELTVLVAQMAAQTKREVIRLFRTPAATAFFGSMDANISSQARILMNALGAKFESLFAKKAKPMAEHMIEGADAASKTALHASLKELTGGLSLKTGVMTQDLTTIYKASVASNVALIKSIPADYLHDVGQAVMRSITTGEGLKDLVPALEKYEGISRRKASNIAKDQTRKAYNTINKGRMEAIGVKQFEWIHSGGGMKPRPLHVGYDGQTFSFDDLPVIDENTGERGIPGQAVNCGCTMAPVFDVIESDETKDVE